MAQFRSLRHLSRRTERRSSARFIVTVFLTTAVVATGGFGAFPENPITNTFQEEIGKNVPESVLEPVNSYLEQLSAPTIPPQPASQPNPPLDLIGLLIDAPASNVETPNPGNQAPSSEAVKVTDSLTQTEPAIATMITHTASAAPTETSTSVMTSTTTSTVTPTPTCLTPSTTLVDVTFFNSSLKTVDIYWVDFSCNLVLKNTLNPGESYVQETYINHVWWFIDSSDGHLIAAHTISSANEFVDVSTGVVAAASATPTPTITDTPMPIGTTATPFAGFYVSTVDLNGFGSAVTVSPGASVVVTYNFQVFNHSFCPACITQLVTGLGSPGTHGDSCAYDGIPPLFPGTTGSENVTLIAPLTPGTYNVVVEYHWQYTCGDALMLYGTGGAVSPQVIGRIVVP